MIKLFFRNEAKILISDVNKAAILHNRVTPHTESSRLNPRHASLNKKKCPLSFLLIIVFKHDFGRDTSSMIVGVIDLQLNTFHIPTENN